MKSMSLKFLGSTWHYVNTHTCERKDGLCTYNITHTETRRLTCVDQDVVRDEKETHGDVNIIPRPRYRIYERALHHPATTIPVDDVHFLRH